MPPPLTEELLTVDNCWGGRGIFFKNEVTGRSSTLQWVALITMNIWVVQIVVGRDMEEMR